MANDRIMILCHWCRDWEYLGKYYPSTSAWIDGETVEAFYYQHRDCNPHHRDSNMDLGETLGLSLLNETQMRDLIYSGNANPKYAWAGVTEEDIKAPLDTAD